MPIAHSAPRALGSGAILAQVGRTARPPSPRRARMQASHLTSRSDGREPARVQGGTDLPQDRDARAALGRCLIHQCDEAIAEILNERPTMKRVKDLSHAGMVEVPSCLATHCLVFIDEDRVAEGYIRQELLKRPTVYVDAGTTVYAKVLRWLLRGSTSSGGPLQQFRYRLSFLNGEHQADVIEAVLARLRQKGRGRSPGDAGPSDRQQMDRADAESSMAHRQLSALEDLIVLVLKAWHFGLASPPATACPTAAAPTGCRRGQEHAAAVAVADAQGIETRPLVERHVMASSSSGVASVTARASSGVAPATEQSNAEELLRQEGETERSSSGPAPVTEQINAWELHRREVGQRDGEILKILEEVLSMWATSYDDNRLPAIDVQILVLDAMLAADGGSGIASPDLETLRQWWSLCTEDKDGNPKYKPDFFRWIAKCTEARNEHIKTGGLLQSSPARDGPKWEEGVAAEHARQEGIELDDDAASACYQKMGRDILRTEATREQQRKLKFKEMGRGLNTPQRSFVASLIRKHIGDKKLALFIFRHGAPRILRAPADVMLQSRPNNAPDEELEERVRHVGDVTREGLAFLAAFIVSIRDYRTDAALPEARRLSARDATEQRRTAILERKRKLAAVSAQEKKGKRLVELRDQKKRDFADMTREEQQIVEDFETGKLEKRRRTATVPRPAPFRGVGPKPPGMSRAAGSHVTADCDKDTDEDTDHDNDDKYQ